MFSHPLIITLPFLLKNEAQALQELVSRSDSPLHIRKPETSSIELCRLLEQIPHRETLSIHHLPQIGQTFQLGGFHTHFPQVVAHSARFLSCPCHSIQQAREVSGVDYLFLSPIFNSISKAGYSSTFTPEELSLQLPSISTPTVALGGICRQNIGQLRAWGFAGAAVLGDLWVHDQRKIHIKETLQRFDQLCKLWQNNQ
jgi:thiamine-phosphate pyrophosphorylase